MSTTCTPQLLFGELKVGDRLPALRHQVTATTVVLGASELCLQCGRH